ncbi:MAG: sigma-70 family RNA polymerase sigma factor [Sedimentisphaerales bacterium]
MLLSRFSTNGDAEAFAEIIKQHAPLVYGVCLRILGDKDNASDAVQDTFLQLVRDAADITGSLPNWLHRTATHRAIDLVRSDSQRKQRELIYTANPGNVDSEDNKAIWREISTCIDEELENLDDQTREVLILRFFEGLTTTDIAKKCNISQPTVSRWIESGIELLRLKLKSRGVIVSAAVFITLLSENIIKAAPVSIMKELGKIAIAGSKATIGAKIASSISAGIAVKTKIMAGMLIVLLGAGLTVVFSFIANGEDKPASIWELVKQSSKKQPASYPNKTTETKDEKNVVNSKINELLDNFAATQKKLASFIATTESSTDYTVSTVKDTNFHRESISKLVIDEKRAYASMAIWGDINPTDHYEKDNPYRKSHWWNGIGHYMYDRPNPNDKSTMVIRLKADKNYDVREEIFKGYSVCAFGMGYLPQNLGRIDTIIRKADSSQVRKKMEEIGDSDCYVIEAKAKTGNYTVWIDPAHGYNIARAEVRKGPGDMLQNDYVLPDNDSLYNFVNEVKFRKIDDIWVPVEADYGSERANLEKQKSHYKITDIELNPDHDTLGSFIPKDISSGAMVMITGENSLFLPGSYIWKDGKVVDINGYEVDLENLGPPSLINGNIIPKLLELNIMLDPVQTKNKMLLICFWDIDQRPSRNAILSLNKDANSLLEKGLYMVFIHAGAVEEKIFTSWLERNEILPPVGVSKDDLSGLGYSWGVQSLPWFTLTDKNHVVIAEGFSLAELDEKITMLNKK